MKKKRSKNPLAPVPIKSGWKGDFREGVRNMNLIEKVFEAMTTDGDGNDKQAQIMEHHYMNSTEDQKKAIDRVFIALCGYCLKTFIEGPEATGSYNPDCSDA